jgi:hypothetical protein
MPRARKTLHHYDVLFCTVGVDYGTIVGFYVDGYQYFIVYTMPHTHMPLSLALEQFTIY